MEEEQIKFGFENDPKFSSEKNIETKESLEDIVKKFKSYSVDQMYAVFKKVFIYDPEMKQTQVQEKQVVLDMLNEISASNFNGEDYDKLPRKEVYNLELAVLHMFGMLQEENLQGNNTPEQHGIIKKQEKDPPSKRHFPSGKSRAEWMLGDDD